MSRMVTEYGDTRFVEGDSALVVYVDEKPWDWEQYGHGRHPRNEREFAFHVWSWIDRMTEPVKKAL